MEAVMEVVVDALVEGDGEGVVNSVLVAVM